MTKMEVKTNLALRQTHSIFRYSLAAFLVAFVAMLSPSTMKFGYEFSKGQSWHYANLYAPFDFAILKPTQQLDSEIRTVKDEFSPYYTLDESIIKTKLQTFELAFNRELAQMPPDAPYPDLRLKPNIYKKAGLNFIERVYKRGIIAFAEEHKLKPNDFVINIVKGNTTEQHTKSGLWSPSQVTDFLSDSLIALPLREADFLFHFMSDIFEPNIFYDKHISDKFLAANLQKVSKTAGMVARGDLIIEKNGIITEDIYQKLLSYKSEYESSITKKRKPEGVFMGHLLLAGLSVGIFMLYLRHHQQKAYRNLAAMLFIFSWPLIFVYFTYNLNASSIYLLPYCIAPIVIKNFFSKRMAFFTHALAILLASMVTPALGIEFLFLQFLAGFTASYNNVITKDWSKFFISILLIFVTYIIGHTAFLLINEGSLLAANMQMYSAFVMNAVFLMLAYPLIPLLGRVFGFTSYISLAELCDLNNPMLRELSLKAAGTFQHSQQVANLAEAAANAIDADAALVRVGALYHDIGKIKNPLFFIENQDGQNPHAGLSNVESAQTIISHVEDGLKIAKKYGLPNIITDFIVTHHGTDRVEYFFKNQIKENPSEPVDESMFRYPGPRPSTKEQTILMIADSLEASAKSLKTPTENDLNALVERIIAGKIAATQLDNSALSFSELEICKQVFKKMLRSIHHARIAYPT